jgi:hypothetical protein
MPGGRPPKYTTDVERLAAKRAKSQRYKQRKKLQNDGSLPILPDVATSTSTTLGIRAPELDIPIGWCLILLQNSKLKTNIPLQSLKMITHHYLWMTLRRYLYYLHYQVRIYLTHILRHPFPEDPYLQSQLRRLYLRTHLNRRKRKLRGTKLRWWTWLIVQMILIVMMI